MNTDRIRLFLDLAKTKNKQKTADNHNITKAQLSYAINALEDEVGVQLINEDPNIIMSSEAASLLPLFQEIVDMEGNIMLHSRKLQNYKKRVLKVGAPPIYANVWLPKAIIEMSLMHPEIDVEVLVANQLSIGEMIDSGIVDIGIENKNIIPSGGIWYPLASRRICVFIPDNYNIPRNKPLRLAEIISLPMVLNPSDEVGSMIYSLFDDGETLNQVIECHVCDGFSLIGLCKEGIGITFLVDLYQKYCPDNVSMYEFEPSIKREIGVFMKQPTSEESEKILYDFINCLKNAVK